MQALLVIDAQNEFSRDGERAVPNHPQALDRIRVRVAEARRDHRPIAWIRHHNRPHEYPGFVPGSWGVELSPGLGPAAGHGPERLFTKDVFGAFGVAELEPWLRTAGAEAVLIVGFYAHMCLSTSSREALVRGFVVAVDPAATGACALDHPVLGRQTAEEVQRTALLHLVHMGVTLTAGWPSSATVAVG